MICPLYLRFLENADIERRGGVRHVNSPEKRKENLSSTVTFLVVEREICKKNMVLDDANNDTHEPFVT